MLRNRRSPSGTLFFLARHFSAGSKIGRKHPMADTTSPELDDAKARVRAQYGSVGDAYVKSAGHATGKDLARMVEVARPQLTDRLLDIATGGGHVARTFSPFVGQIVASDLTPEILHHAAVAFAEQ